jgi:RHS repeat-associated protein
MVVNAACPQTVPSADVYETCVVWHASYDEYGRRELVKGDEGLHSFGFAGGLYDHETGLTRFGARDYDAQVGRWTARDPVLFGGAQANLFAYVGNDPVNFRDPRGLWTVGAFVSGGAGLGWGVGGGAAVVGSSSDGGLLGTLGSGAAYGAGVGGGLQFTNADSVQDLTGWGGSIGVSLGILGIEVDYGNGYWGVSIGLGVGAEYHARADHTWRFLGGSDDDKDDCP